MPATSYDEQVPPTRGPDEETPLLSSSEPPPQKATPVPWAQVWILLVLLLAEPLTSQVIYPFTPEFVRNVGITHGDESRVGLYVGMMHSVFFAAQTITVLHWGRLSDIVGRKPVVLVGLFGLSLSMFGFGLSTTYWSAASWRGLNGILNGNVGIIKSIIAEITDPTNAPQVFAYIPITLSVGGTLGPIVGGTLSRPADRFSDTFGNSEFLRNHPYFLPCAVSASFSGFTWILTFLFLRETIPYPKTLRTLLTRKPKAPSSVGPSEIDDAEKPYPLRSLITRRRVLLSVINYAALSFVDISYRAIRPLFFSTPISSGGLGLDPPSIGKILAWFGILTGIFQVTFFARANALWGTKRLFVGGLCCAVPVFALFPVMNAMARVYGVGLAVYSAVALQIIFSLGQSSCLGCIFIYVSAASPNRASLGATNGIAQLLMSITRTIGPTAATSLFSLSLERGYIGGNLVYIVLLIVSLAAIALGTMLPQQVRQS